MFSRPLGYVLLCMALVLGGLFALRVSQLRYQPPTESRVDTRSILSSALQAGGETYTLSHMQHQRLINALSQMQAFPVAEQDRDEQVAPMQGLEAIIFYLERQASLRYELAGQVDGDLVIRAPGGQLVRADIRELLLEVHDA